MGCCSSDATPSVSKEINSMKRAKTILLIIDPQVDFHAGGTLAVDGAVEDSLRIASLVKNNPSTFDDIYITLDSHNRNHIAHSVFWKNTMNDSPNPFTIISHSDIVEEKWLPRNISNLSHCLTYTKFMEDQGKYKLIIWPEHCLIGTIGHAVIPSINEAIQEWSVINGKDINYIHKGQNNLTEMYSAMKAEFTINSDKRTKLNVELLQSLQEADKLIICGQALSHCVKCTFVDILNNWPIHKRNQIILLSDGSSSVCGFEEEGKEFIRYVLDAGCLVSTTQDVMNLLIRKRGRDL